MPKLTKILAIAAALALGLAGISSVFVSQQASAGLTQN